MPDQKQIETVRDALVAKMGLAPAIAEQLAKNLADEDLRELVKSVDTRSAFEAAFTSSRDRRRAELEAQKKPTETDDPDADEGDPAAALR